VARRSDGSVVAWGYNGNGQCNVPALSPGLSYVEVAAGGGHTVARRSDGSVVAWGENRGGQTHVPVVPAGLTYVEVASDYYHAVARVGPRSSYTFLGAGCAGSLPAARLVPLDTPRIGATFEVRLFELPASAAIMLTSSRTTSVALGPFGLPGCTLFTYLEFATPVIGAFGQATWTLPIPRVPALVGVTLHQQAIVFDPAAGNPAGLVMSEAKSATIGGR
jgi:hypothetical protein